MRDIAVLIPALDPGRDLIEYCDRLIASGIETLILVDDGSDSEHATVFKELSDRCLVLTHPHNLGKGRALKDAFKLIMSGALTDTVSCDESDLSKWEPYLKQIKVIVTADSDGQHAVEDVLAVGREALSHGDALVLGARDFDNENVPFKSRNGNKITRRLFKLLHRLELVDTQTGLRGIPVSILDRLIKGKGNRFEYELDMLVIAARTHIPVVEVPIETIYENNNEQTHFRAVRDSIAVYRILFGTFFKYLIASLSSFVVDILFFRMFLAMFSGLSEATAIMFATAGARVVSSIYNFLMNKTVVFLKEGKNIQTAAGYYTLCICQTAASAGLVILLHRFLPLEETYVKVIVDSLLFCISYQIQKHIVFASRD